MTFAASSTLDAPRPLAAPRSDVLRLGYVRLTDAAPLLVADALGLFHRRGVTVSLSRVGAWAALRDHIALGHLDGGQMLSPMPIAAHLGVSGLATPLSVVATLARHGNTITLGEALMAEIAAAAPELAALRPLPAQALAAAIVARRGSGRPLLTFAVVFAFSSHNYLLRHWLAAAGIDPERDMQLVVVAPPMVANELADGRIDGFCAGEPWGSRAVHLGLGRIGLTTADIWLNHPEKVLAIGQNRLRQAPERISTCVAAIIEAGIWLSDPANHGEATRIVHRTAVPDVPEAVVGLALARQLVLAPGEAPTSVQGLQFHPAATYPHPEHGAWWATQMQRWGHIGAQPDTLIPSIWRPDIWRLAALEAGISPQTPPCPACPPIA